MDKLRNRKARNSKLGQLEGSNMIPFDAEEALKSGIYISGTTGSGKSDTAMKIAEFLMALNVIVVVFDPSQDWIERSALKHMLQPRMNDLYVWEGYVPQKSIIFDMSQLVEVEKEGFIEDFCKALMLQQSSTPKTDRKQYFLMFEEAHTYFPQGCMSARRHRNSTYMMTQGRNYGVRFGCITQFAALLDKKAMRYMKQRYFGYTDEPNDVNYIRQFFKKEERRWIEETLPTLKAGTFIYKNGAIHQVFYSNEFHSDTTPQLVTPPQQPVKQNAASIHGDAAEIMRILMFVGLFVVVMLIIGNMR